MDNVEGFAYIEFEVSKDGKVLKPAARAEAVAYFGEGKVTDVLVISHGWNNDWATATTKYEQFLTGFGRMRRDHGLEVGREFRPLLAGVFWPSTALVGSGVLEVETRSLDPDVAKAYRLTTGAVHRLEDYLLKFAAPVTR